MRIIDVEEKLYQALTDAENNTERSSKFSSLIDFVLDNTHKTYKYILITALASKAADENVNPLCLQAGSALPGAYDARSVCHGVIVDFDKNELEKALDGSNEPFLNKPARFSELAKTNAVRHGNDQKILNALCEELPKIRTSADAYDGLVYAMTKLLRIKEKNEELTHFDYSSLKGETVILAKFINKILDENFGGETLTLSVAGLFELYLNEISNDYRVEVHPVNQK